MSIIKHESLHNTAIMYMHQTSIRSQIIYCVTIIAVLIGFAALPFVYTTVSIKSSGSLQSNIEKIELFAPISGRIVKLSLKDNQKVVVGKILLSIDASSTIQQTSLLKNRINDLSQLLQDAGALTNFDFNSSSSPILQTGFYLASWQQYSEQNQNELNTLQQTLKIYNRYENLYTQKVVTQAEYEEHKYDYEQARSNYAMVGKKYKGQWQTETNQYRNELQALQNQKIQLTEQNKSYILNAPISGSLQNLTGLQLGSFITANQKIGEISPDSALLAICYVRPSEIGLIKKGQNVTFQIDAFNYNQWGLLPGKVNDISDDIVFLNESPYFKIKCMLDRNYLILKNGYKGQVKKGMSFHARFTVTRRSLYELLYDNIDDWLNPNYENQKET